MKTKHINILGIRGLPASHGGFETFAENLALYLIKQGWIVTVFCQESAGDVAGVCVSDWNGVRRIHIPVNGDGAKATVVFDYLSVVQAIKEQGLFLTLGYNTALFNVLFRLKGRKNLINMDGIEWTRPKWKWYEKTWLYLNERAGCLIANHLIADHPEIKSHLVTRVSANKVTMIPYGARSVVNADIELLKDYGLRAGEYALVIARPEPENSILEIVRAYSARPRGKSLVVLGKYEQKKAYHSQVLDVASKEVMFVGAVYDHATLNTLRFYSCLYIHGHTVGGTNPSLIEALGAGQPVLAHDNKFNRWVAGDDSLYFSNEEKCNEILTNVLDDKSKLRSVGKANYRRYLKLFTWDKVLEQYNDLLVRYT